MTDQMDQAGAMPAASGATPPVAGQQAPSGATPPGQAPAAGATPPAAGTTDGDYPEGLGEAGKRALDAERDRATKFEKEAKTANAELEKVRKANQTEHEKAVEAAKAEGWTQAAGIVRRSEVRRALTAAGCRLVDLAAKADEFSGLDVNPEDGTVKDLDKVVERFKVANPEAFGAATRPADYGGGPRGEAASGGASINDMIRRAAGR